VTTARRLIQTGTLAPRGTRADRIAHMAEDVRSLSARLRASLIDQSAKSTVTGWTLDDDSWEFAINDRTIVLSVILRRPA
jgi:hypothetical protein